MKSIIKLESHEIISYEEFSQKLHEFSPPETITDFTANLYSLIPAKIKALKNFDPTGLSSYLCDILDDNKKKREDESIKKALYLLYFGIKSIEKNNIELIEDKVHILLEKYFQYSRINEIDKIEYFRNVFIHGIISNETSLSEDKRVYEILDSLDLLQINILKIIYDKQKSYSYDELRGKDSADKRIRYSEIVDKLTGHDKDKIKQLCIDLIGNGLLEDWGLGRFDYKGPDNYIINEYTKKFIEYIIL